MIIFKIFKELSIEILATIIITLSALLLGFCSKFIKRKKESNNVILSPDGKKICFVKTKRGNRDIFIIDIDSGNTIPLVTHPADDESPVWSPDSLKIAFVSNRRDSRNIYVINCDGTDLLELTNDDVDNHSPMWASDNNKIIYKARWNGSTVIKIIDIEEKRNYCKS